MWEDPLNEAWHAHWPRNGTTSFCKYTLQAAPHSILVAFAANVAVRHGGCSLGKS